MKDDIVSKIREVLKQYGIKANASSLLFTDELNLPVQWEVNVSFTINIKEVLNFVKDKEC